MAELAGTALLTPAEDVVRELERPVLLEHGPALYLGLAGVKREFMRRGIGRAMVEFAEATAKARGYARLLLSALREMGNVDYYTNSAGFKMEAGARTNRQRQARRQRPRRQPPCPRRQPR